MIKKIPFKLAIFVTIAYYSVVVHPFKLTYGVLKRFLLMVCYDV